MCGHATFTDYKLLLERNGFWNKTIASYLAKIVNRCTACRSTSVSQPNRKVSVSSLSKTFNEILYVDHLHLGEIVLVQTKDLITRYSTVYAATSRNLKEAVVGFEAARVSYFQYPDSVRGERAFRVGAFNNYLEKLGTAIHPVPPGRHYKNSIDSKHNIIRCVYCSIVDGL